MTMTLPRHGPYTSITRIITRLAFILALLTLSSVVHAGSNAGSSSQGNNKKDKNDNDATTEGSTTSGGGKPSIRFLSSRPNDVRRLSVLVEWGMPLIATGGKDGGKPRPQNPNHTFRLSAIPKKLANATTLANPSLIYMTPGVMTIEGKTSSLLLSSLRSGEFYRLVVWSVIGDLLPGIGPDEFIAANPPNEPPRVEIASYTDVDVTLIVIQPSDDGGIPFESYTCQSSQGQETTVTVPLPSLVVITGLTPNVLVSFTCTARNILGITLPSVATQSIRPLAVPTQPRDVQAMISLEDPESTARITFMEPINSGGLPITRYDITSIPAGASAESLTAGSVLVSGLTAGMSYRFSVVAVSDFASSSPSESSNDVIPTSRPDAPTTVTLLQGMLDTATVQFDTPIDRGMTITSFTLNASPSGLSVSGDASPLTISGLPYGSETVFTVTASNARGVSDVSLPSLPFLVVGPPTPVRNLLVSVNQPGSESGSAIVTFDEPVNNRGSTIITYRITASPTESGTGGDVNIDVSLDGPISRPVTVLGLSVGVSYTFHVIAVNDAGTSDVVMSNSVVATGFPGEPTDVVLHMMDDSLDLEVIFVAPVNNGFLPITSYALYLWDGSLFSTGDSSPLRVSADQLIVGESYQFVVRALNLHGEGSSSSFTTAFVHTVGPTEPREVIAQVLTTDPPRSIRVSFQTPLASRGSPVRQFTVTSKPPGSTSVSVLAPVDSVLVEDLDPTVAYSFIVVARNDDGDSVPSESTESVFPSDVPSAPIGVIATIVVDGLSITFDAGEAIDGMLPILEFEATASPGGMIVRGSSSPILFTGLTIGTSYTFVVTASNGRGASVPSDVSLPTRFAVAPAAPVGVSAYLDVETYTVIIQWQPSIDDGGSEPHSYMIVASTGDMKTLDVSILPGFGLPHEPVFVESGEVPAEPLFRSLYWSDLPVGIMITFQIRSINGAGSSPLSSETNGITIPTGGPPPSPTNVLVEMRSDNTLDISFDPPTNRVGADIIGWVVEVQEIANPIEPPPNEVSPEINGVVPVYFESTSPEVIPPSNPPVPSEFPPLEEAEPVVIPPLSDDELEDLWNTPLPDSIPIEEETLSEGSRPMHVQSIASVPVASESASDSHTVYLSPSPVVRSGPIASSSSSRTLHHSSAGRSLKQLGGQPTLAKLVYQLRLDQTRIITEQLKAGVKYITTVSSLTQQGVTSTSPSTPPPPVTMSDKPAASMPSIVTVKPYDLVAQVVDPNYPQFVPNGATVVLSITVPWTYLLKIVIVNVTATPICGVVDGSTVDTWPACNTAIHTIRQEFRDPTMLQPCDPESTVLIQHCFRFEMLLTGLHGAYRPYVLTVSAVNEYGWSPTSVPITFRPAGNVPSVTDIVVSRSFTAHPDTPTVPATQLDLSVGFKYTGPTRLPVNIALPVVAVLYVESVIGDGRRECGRYNLVTSSSPLLCKNIPADGSLVRVRVETSFDFGNSASTITADQLAAAGIGTSPSVTHDEPIAAARLPANLKFVSAHEVPVGVRVRYTIASLPVGFGVTSFSAFIRLYPQVSGQSTLEVRTIDNWDIPGEVVIPLVSRGVQMISLYAHNIIGRSSTISSITFAFNFMRPQLLLNIQRGANFRTNDKQFDYVVVRQMGSPYPWSTATIDLSTGGREFLPATGAVLSWYDQLSGTGGIKYTIEPYLKSNPVAPFRSAQVRLATEPPFVYLPTRTNEAIPRPIFYARSDTFALYQHGMWLEMTGQDFTTSVLCSGSTRPGDANLVVRPYLQPMEYELWIVTDELYVWKVDFTRTIQSPDVRDPTNSFVSVIGAQSGLHPPPTLTTNAGPVFEFIHPPLSPPFGPGSFTFKHPKYNAPISNIALASNGAILYTPYSHPGLPPARDCNDGDFRTTCYILPFNSIAYLKLKLADTRDIGEVKIFMSKVTPVNGFKLYIGENEDWTLNQLIYDDALVFVPGTIRTDVSVKAPETIRVSRLYGQIWRDSCCMNYFYLNEMIVFASPEFIPTFDIVCRVSGSRATNVMRIRDVVHTTTVTETKLIELGWLKSARHDCYMQTEITGGSLVFSAPTSVTLPLYRSPGQISVATRIESGSIFVTLIESSAELVRTTRTFSITPVASSEERSEIPPMVFSRGAGGPTAQPEPITLEFNQARLSVLSTQPLTNLALQANGGIMSMGGGAFTWGSVTTQQGPMDNRVAANCNDGNPTTICHSLIPQVYAYLQLLLPTSRIIGEVNIINRLITDCSICAPWMNGFKLYIGDNVNYLLNPMVYQDVSGGSRSSVSVKPAANVQWQGQYIHFLLDTGNYLGLAEMQVFGLPSMTPTLVPLSAGQEVRFHMQSWNQYGQSDFIISQPIRVPGRPSRPRDIQATFINTDAFMTAIWQPSEFDGFIPILRYEVLVMPTVSTHPEPWVIQLDNTLRMQRTPFSIQIFGLKLRGWYSFCVTAVNGFGSSQSSCYGSYIQATFLSAPDPPRIGVPRQTGYQWEMAGQVMIPWDAPVWDGGSVVSRYTLTAFVWQQTQYVHLLQASDVWMKSPLSFTLLLSPGQYRFSIVATNSKGTSVSSGTSQSILVIIGPLKPTDVKAKLNRVTTSGSVSKVSVTVTYTFKNTLTIPTSKVNIWASRVDAGALTPAAPVLVKTESALVNPGVSTTLSALVLQTDIPFPATLTTLRFTVRLDTTLASGLVSEPSLPILYGLPPNSPQDFTTVQRHATGLRLRFANFNPILHNTGSTDRTVTIRMAYVNPRPGAPPLIPDPTLSYTIPLTVPNTNSGYDYIFFPYSYGRFDNSLTSVTATNAAGLVSDPYYIENGVHTDWGLVSQPSFKVGLVDFPAGLYHIDSGGIADELGEVRNPLDNTRSQVWIRAPPSTVLAVNPFGASVGYTLFGVSSGGIPKLPPSSILSDPWPHSNTDYRLGAQWTSRYGDTISGVSYWLAPQVVGEPTPNVPSRGVYLWSITGTTINTVSPLATGNLPSGTTEKRGGWNTISFTTPYSLTAGTQYFIAYDVPRGNYFSNGLVAPFPDAFTLNTPSAINIKRNYLQKDGTAPWTNNVVVESPAANLFFLVTPVLQSTGETTLFGASNGGVLNQVTPTNVLVEPDTSMTHDFRMGVQWTSRYADTITGVTYYLSTEQTTMTSRVVYLWEVTSTGGIPNVLAPLRSATRPTSEVLGSWNTVTFTQSYTLKVGVNYFIAYDVPKGHRYAQAYQSPTNRFTLNTVTMNIRRAKISKPTGGNWDQTVIVDVTTDANMFFAVTPVIRYTLPATRPVTPVTFNPDSSEYNTFDGRAASLINPTFEPWSVEPPEVCLLTVEQYCVKITGQPVPFDTTSTNPTPYDTLPRQLFDPRNNMASVGATSLTWRPMLTPEHLRVFPSGGRIYLFTPMLRGTPKTGPPGADFITIMFYKITGVKQYIVTATCAETITSLCDTSQTLPLETMGPSVGANMFVLPPSQVAGVGSNRGTIIFDSSKLNRGVKYTFTIRGVNSQYTSPSSPIFGISTQSLTKSLEPPTIISVEVRRDSPYVWVTFNEPLSGGLLAYTELSVNPPVAEVVRGTNVGSGLTNTIRIQLPPRTSGYTFTVTAVPFFNQLYPTYSRVVPSAPFDGRHLTIPDVPGPPTSCIVVSKTVLSVVISFIPPEFLGGDDQRIEWFQITSEPTIPSALNGFRFIGPTDVMNGYSTITATIEGMIYGTSYRFRVQAWNGWSYGPASEWSTVVNGFVSPSATSPRVHVYRYGYPQYYQLIRFEAPSHTGGANVAEIEVCARLYNAALPTPIDCTSRATFVDRQLLCSQYDQLCTYNLGVNDLSDTNYRFFPPLGSRAHTFSVRFVTIITPVPTEQSRRLYSEWSQTNPVAESLLTPTSPVVRSITNVENSGNIRIVLERSYQSSALPADAYLISAMMLVPHSGGVLHESTNIIEQRLNPLEEVTPSIAGTPPIELIMGGLTPGFLYRIRVQAVWGAELAPKVPIVWPTTVIPSPLTRPSALPIGYVVEENPKSFTSQLLINVRPPVYDGGSPITGYAVRVASASRSPVVVIVASTTRVQFDGGEVRVQFTVMQRDLSDLRPGYQEQIVVTAVNAIGESDGLSLPITISAMPRSPLSPLNVKVTAIGGAVNQACGSTRFQFDYQEGGGAGYVVRQTIIRQVKPLITPTPILRVATKSLTTSMAQAIWTGTIDCYQTYTFEISNESDIGEGDKVTVTAYAPGRPKLKPTLIDAQVRFTIQAWDIHGSSTALDPNHREYHSAIGYLHVSAQYPLSQSTIDGGATRLRMSVPTLSMNGRLLQNVRWSGYSSSLAPEPEAGRPEGYYVYPSHDGTTSDSIEVRFVRSCHGGECLRGNSNRCENDPDEDYNPLYFGARTADVTVWAENEFGGGPATVLTIQLPTKNHEYRVTWHQNDDPGRWCANPNRPQV